LFAFLRDDSEDLSTENLLMGILEVLEMRSASPVALTPPVTNPVPVTNNVDGSSNLGGDHGIMLLVAVHSKMFIATTAKTIASLDLACRWARGVLLEGLLGPARVGCGGLLGRSTSGR